MKLRISAAADDSQPSEAKARRPARPRRGSPVGQESRPGAELPDAIDDDAYKTSEKGLLLRLRGGGLLPRPGDHVLQLSFLGQHFK